jgi:hypothetical protein
MRSQISWTWLRRWEQSRTVMPRFLKSRMRSRISREPGGIDAGGGLVEDEEARLLDEGLGEADALEHAFRVAAEAAVAGVLEADQVRGAPRRARGVSRREAADFSVEMERLLAGEEFVEVGVLREEADFLAALDLAAVAPEDAGAAGAGGDEAEDDLHGGALAGAVGAQEAVNLAGLDIEREIAHGGDALAPEGDGEDLGEVLDGDGEGSE